MKDLFKHALPTLIIFSVVAIAFKLFIYRYTISFPTLENKCLNGTLFIVDKLDKSYEKGDLLAFTFDIDNDLHFKQGMKFIKKVGAVSGDEVSVEPTFLTVNEKIHQLNMWSVSDYLKKDANLFRRTIQIRQNEIFMIGETIASYDSRFWGPINDFQIIGRAYEIF